MKKLFLIDGNAIIHRAFHAFPPHFRTKDGELINAVYGFTSMLLNIINIQKPDYFAVSFDRAAKTFRHEEYKEYKATRTKAPDELYSQIPRIRNMVETFNMPIYDCDRYEADDVLGTLAVQAAKLDDLETYIVTGDMDPLQLVNPKVFVYAPQPGFKDAKIYNAAKVEEKYGLTPDQVIDYKSLKGDSSDNIPGVPGIGDKGAVRLLQQYKTLDGIYEHLDEITGSIHNKLADNKEKAYFSQYLATIVLDVPVTLDLKDCKTHEYDKEKVLKLFEELQFRSLIAKLDGPRMSPKNPNIREPLPNVPEKPQHSEQKQTSLF